MKSADILKPDRFGLLDDAVEAFLQIQLPSSSNFRVGFDIGNLSIEEAYEVQCRVVAARVAKGEEVVGYKVGCTSTPIRRQFGLTEPISGRLLSAGVFQGGAILNWDDFAGCTVEPELVLVIGKDVRNEVRDERELADAIEYVSPGIGIQNSEFRFGKPTVQELVASNCLHAGLVVGTERFRPVGRDLDVEGVGLFQNGKLVDYGIGADILGGPLKSLSWLANHLLRRGEYLKAGQMILPGSPVDRIPVERGNRIAARFTRLGSVEAEFRA